MPRDKYVDELLNPTVFPVGLARDFSTASAKVKEIWRRMYPQISYRRIKASVSTEPVSEQGRTRPVGWNSGGSLVDPLYRESIPSAPIAAVVQPHSPRESPQRTAPHHTLYFDPQPIHAYMRVTINDYVLKRWGIEERFDIIAIFNTPELDELKVAVSQGDRFLWQGQEYEVHQRVNYGWWYNTDLFLYIVTTCNRARLGS